MTKINTHSTERSPLLKVEHLSKHFVKRLSLIQRTSRTVRALQDVSFEVFPEQTYGIVGESGCGKTTLLRSILRVIQPTAGEVIFDGVNLQSLSKRELRAKRRDIQMVFQNPFNSLNPRLSVFGIISEPLKSHTGLRHDAIQARVLSLLDQVGLERDHLYRYAHEFSGGQLQRIAIARALSLNPKLLALDEPTSALDVSVQAQIISLLQELQQKLHLTYLFISHNLTLVHYFSDQIAVMYLGRIVESGKSEQVFHDPQHPYTKVLLSSTPSLSKQHRKDRILTEGSVPDPGNPPPGCAFHPRCPYVMQVCREVTPPLLNLEDGRQVACHLLSS